MKKALIFFRFLFGFTTLVGQSNNHTDQWYSSFLENKQVGYIHEVYRMSGSENHHHSSSRIVLTRGNTKAEVTVEADYVENAETGILKSIRSMMKMSNQMTQNTFINGQDSISLTQKMGDKSYLRKLPAQGIVYGPHWIKNNSIKKLKKEGDEFQFKTYSPDFGLYLSGTRKVVATEYIDDKPALVIEESFVEMPVKRKLWVNHNFDVVKMVDVTPFGAMESVLTSQESATTDLSLVSLPAEFFDRTLAKSNIRLANARAIESITLKIEKRAGSTVAIPKLTSEFQEILEATEQFTVLKVTVPSLSKGPAPCASLPVDELTDYLEPNALINSDDADIIKIANEITSGLKSNYEKCLALEKWVTNNMIFDTGIVLAPASEVCRERKGTCASYTTFLAALFRAAGIPSRYNMGFVYMGGIWGGHAWPDAYVDGQWIPFDAAVNGDGSADAARFSFGVTSLKNGAGELNAMPGGLLYGNVDVQVLSYVIDGKETVISPEDKKYVISDDVYYSKSLGLTIRKPIDFEFDNLNESWPNYTIASLKSKNSTEKVKIVQTMLKPNDSHELALKNFLQKQIPNGKLKYVKYRGMKVLQIEAVEQSGVAILKGQDVWFIKADGKSARELLEKALNWIEI